MDHTGNLISVANNRPTCSPRRRTTFEHQTTIEKYAVPDHFSGWALGCLSRVLRPLGKYREAVAASSYFGLTYSTCICSMVPLNLNGILS